MRSSESVEVVYQESFDKTVDFYNRNHQIFKSFEQSYGVNIWWLIHFRVYFSLRNAKLHSTIENQERQVSSPAVNRNIMKIAAVFSSVSMTLKELVLMFLSYRKPRVPNGVLVLTEPFRSDEGIFGQLENDFNSIGNREILNPKKETPTLGKFRSQTLSVDHLVVARLVDFGSVCQLLKLNRALKSLYAELVSRNQASNDFDAILLQFKQSRFSLLVYYLRYLAFEKVFRESDVSAIVMQDENSPQQKVIQNAARKHGVSVFAYQHGNIHRWNPAYNYSSYFEKPTLPDTTFVWGEHSREMLTSWGGYSPDSIVVTGRIKPHREIRIKNPILNSGKKIILYASQPLPDIQLRAQYLNDVLLAANGFISEYQLVIRPHPAETNDDYFLSAAKTVGYSNLIVDRQTDLTTHMEICDVLITAFSTVGTEFIPQYKPLLVLDYPKEDLMDWVAKGVGIQITDRSDLEKALSTRMNIQKTKYDEFVQRHFFQLDDQAANRIKDYVHSQTV